jgi:GrpB-like predicted nucleotidyltransferase (UPF0157 family)
MDGRDGTVPDGGPDPRLERLMQTVRAVKRLRAKVERWGAETVEEHFRRLRTLRLPDLPLTVREHDPTWAAIFAREKDRLMESLESVVDIQHFGSTSIPTLPSKDIIDLLVAVQGPALTLEREQAFARLGYEAYGNSPVDPQAVWFWHTGGNCAFAAHVCEHGRPWMTTVVNFRDFLRSHPAERARYAEAKLRLAAEEGQDYLGYSVGKLALIGEVNEKAAAWIAAGRPGRP